MPLVRISLREGRSQPVVQKISDAIHRAMVETISIPADDRFQIISEHRPANLVYDPEFLNIHRTDEIVVIQITLNQGRSLEIKKALYARIAELLHQETGLRKEDVLINLVEVPKENWSFGNGIAQYAP
ncbi:MAG TPA: tautomerase family protein [Candidatus Saccharimonadales bacterium]|jgi:4-oxalocrotonate tautomerase|nr:tautomerase family protein [Candidatus Saccharimonadales bacterium]